MKYFFLYIAFLLLAVSARAQNETVLSGVFLQKPWSKNLTSYCAGGSEYFVCKKGKEETILDLSGDGKMAIQMPKSGKKIKVKGYFKTFTPEIKDPMSQHPADPVTCRVFVVTTRLK
jgi:hypothetical protein